MTEIYTLTSNVAFGVLLELLPHLNDINRNQAIISVPFENLSALSGRSLPISYNGPLRVRIFEASASIITSKEYWTTWALSNISEEDRCILKLRGVETFVIGDAFEWETAKNNTVTVTNQTHVDILLRLKFIDIVLYQ